MITTKKLNDNLGGLLKIWVMFPSDFNVNGPDIIITNPEHIYQLYFTPGTMNFKEEIKSDNPAGDFFSVDITGFIPFDTKALLEYILEIEKQDCCVLFQTENEDFKLAGNVFYPLKLYANRESGKEMSDRAGWNCRFHGLNTQRVLSVNNPF